MAKPSNILKKLNRLIEPEKINLTLFEKEWLKDDEIIDADLLEKIMFVCAKNNIIINHVLFNDRKLLLRVPLAK